MQRIFFKILLFKYFWIQQTYCHLFHVVIFLIRYDYNDNIDALVRIKLICMIYILMFLFLHNLQHFFFKNLIRANLSHILDLSFHYLLFLFTWLRFSFFDNNFFLFFPYLFCFVLFYFISLHLIYSVRITSLITFIFTPYISLFFHLIYLHCVYSSYTMIILTTFNLFF